MSDKILPDSRVTLYFELSIDDGQVVDSNFEGEPATFTMGDGSLLPAFEEASASQKFKPPFNHLCLFHLDD